MLRNKGTGGLFGLNRYKAITKLRYLFKPGDRCGRRRSSLFYRLTGKILEGARFGVRTTSNQKCTRFKNAMLHEHTHNSATSLLHVRLNNKPFSGTVCFCFELF